MTNKIEPGEFWTDGKRTIEILMTDARYAYVENTSTKKQTRILLNGFARFTLVKKNDLKEVK